MVKSLLTKRRHATRSKIFAVLVAFASKRHAALRAEEAARGGLGCALLTLIQTKQILEGVNVELGRLLRAETGARWIADYLAERVTNYIPGHVRKHLCGGGPRNELRAARGQCGHSCEGCGAVGFYQAACPVCRGNLDAPQTGMKREGIMLDRACANYKALEQDAVVECAMSSATSKKPYLARYQGEANLHVVLHRAIEILKVELRAVVPPFASSLLVPKSIKRSQFYSVIYHEDRRYFEQQLERPSSLRQAHHHRGFVRAPDGDVHDRNEVTKRGLAYTFDRSATYGDQRNKETLRNFRQDPRAGKRNIHGYKDWININSSHEQHATTGRFAASENKHLENALKMQGAWSKAQSTLMQDRRKICTHLLSIVLRELSAEAKRESILIDKLSGDLKEERVEVAKVEQQRYEAADRVMRMVAEYGRVTAAEEAKYLHYTISQRNGGLPQALSHDSKLTKGQNMATIAMLHSHINPSIYESQVDSIECEKSGPLRIEGSNNEAYAVERTGQLLRESQSYEDPLPIGDGIYAPVKRSCGFSSTKQLRSIVSSGGYMRKGQYTDNTALKPAVIPMPKALYSGGLSNSSTPNVSEVVYGRLWNCKSQISKAKEKSPCANIILHAARRGHAGCTEKMASASVTLWD